LRLYLQDFQSEIQFGRVEISTRCIALHCKSHSWKFLCRYNL